MKLIKLFALGLNLVVWGGFEQEYEGRIIHDTYTFQDGSVITGSFIIDLYLEFLEDYKEAVLGGMTDQQIEAAFIEWLVHKFEKEWRREYGTLSDSRAADWNCCGNSSNDQVHSI